MNNSEQEHYSTHLAAFAFADVAGYSRLMSDDSMATVREWQRLREEVLLESLNRFSGRAVSLSGDALLVEFRSVVDALRWALQVQARSREGKRSENRMQLRIGVNVDDVHDDGQTLQSDGVVVASRIHQLAAPGEIVVTRIVRDIVRGRIDVRFRDLGMPALKNIDRPVQVFSVTDRTSDHLPVRPHASWSSRPTLAVLPFEDYGGDAGDHYFAQGMTEEIITGVSRSRSMFVVARSSTLQVVEKAKSPKEIASALGVKYLLTGSIRRSADKLRIHTELINVDHGQVAWAEQFDGSASDLFEFQDRIAASIVATLEPKVMKAETDHLGARPTESLDAYDCVLRALSEFYLANETGFRGALDLFSRAVDLDRGYARAHSYLAWCLNFIIAEGYSADVAADRARAVEHARTSLDLDPEDAFNLSVRGHLMAFLEGRPYEALDMLDEALRLNENLPLAWGLSATAHAYLGDGDETQERLLNVWRLNPYDPLNYFFWTAGGLGEFVAGRHDTAITWLQKAHRIKPQFMACQRLLAASLALDGQNDRAREIAAEMMKQDPGFSISKFMAWYPLKKPETRERLILGLSAAGLPK